jgi:hypothetical protein
MNARERRYITGQVASGRRAAERLVGLLEVGFDPAEAVGVVAPGLSPIAAAAAEKLAAQASLYLSCAAVVLAGLVDDSTLAVVNIPEVPAGAARAWQEASGWIRISSGRP